MAIDTIKATAILDGSVDTADLADNAVTTAKITDGNVTSAKIGDGEVTSAKLDTNINIAGTLDVTGVATLDDDLNVDSGTLFVDASENRVGVGTSSPSKQIHLEGLANNDGVLLSSSADTDTAYIFFGDTTSTSVGRIAYDHNEDRMEFFTGGSQNVTIDSSGNVGIGFDSPDEPLHVRKANAGDPVTILHNSSTAAQDEGQVLELRTERGTGTAGAVPVIRLVGSASSSSFDLFRVDSDGDIYSVVNNSASTVMQQWGCRAWVNFNGIGTVAIRDSGNVSSITDHNTGEYTINFSTSMPDANYAASGLSGNLSGGTGSGRMISKDGTFGTTSARIANIYAESQRIDDDFIGVMFVR